MVGWLKGKVSSGRDESEKYFCFQDRRGMYRGGFLPNNLVRSSRFYEHDSAHVQVVEKDGEEGVYIVCLPKSSEWVEVMGSNVEVIE